MVKGLEYKKGYQSQSNEVSEQLCDVVVDAKLISTFILQELLQHGDLRASASQ